MLLASRPVCDTQMETEAPASKWAGGACSGIGDEPPAAPAEVTVRAPGHYFQSCPLDLVPAPTGYKRFSWRSAAGPTGPRATPLKGAWWAAGWGRRFPKYGKIDEAE